MNQVGLLPNGSEDGNAKWDTRGNDMVFVVHYGVYHCLPPAPRTTTIFNIGNRNETSQDSQRSLLEARNIMGTSWSAGACVEAIWVYFPIPISTNALPICR